jgi:hypothetical protein
MRHGRDNIYGDDRIHDIYKRINTVYDNGEEEDGENKFYSLLYNAGGGICADDTIFR